MRVAVISDGKGEFRRRKVERVMGIEHMLVDWISARNGRFREAVAAFLMDCSWPITDPGELLESTRNFGGVQRDRRRVGSHGAKVREAGQIGNRD
jgi:hypothetical protein